MISFMIYFLYLVVGCSLAQWAGTCLLGVYIAGIMNIHPD